MPDVTEIAARSTVADTVLPSGVETFPFGNITGLADVRVAPGGPGHVAVFLGYMQVTTNGAATTGTQRVANAPDGLLLRNIGEQNAENIKAAVAQTEAFFIMVVDIQADEGPEGYRYGLTMAGGGVAGSILQAAMLAIQL